MEKRGAVFILSKTAKFSYEVKYFGTSVVVEVKTSKLDVIPRLEGDELSITISLELDGNLLYTEKRITLLEDDFKKIELLVNEAVKEDIVHTINKRLKRNSKAIVFTFISIFRRAYPNEFKTCNWNERYSNAKVGVKVDTKITFDRSHDYEPKRDEVVN